MYNGNYYYERIKKNIQEKSNLKVFKIIKKQINLLGKRISLFQNVNINDIENFTFMENININ